LQIKKKAVEAVASLPLEEELLQLLAQRGQRPVDELLAALRVVRLGFQPKLDVDLFKKFHEKATKSYKFSI
jgi:ribosomal protein L10